MAAGGAGLAFEAPGAVALACAGPVAFGVANVVGGDFPGRMLTVAAVGLLGLISGVSRRQMFQRARQATLLAVAEERAEVARREATLIAERNHLGREIQTFSGWPHAIERHAVLPGVRNEDSRRIG